MVSGEVRGPLAVRSCAVGDQSDVRDLTVLLPTVARREMSDVLSSGECVWQRLLAVAGRENDLQ